MPLKSAIALATVKCLSLHAAVQGGHHVSSFVNESLVPKNKQGKNGMEGKTVGTGRDLGIKPSLLLLKAGYVTSGHAHLSLRFPISTNASGGRDGRRECQG